MLRIVTLRPHSQITYSTNYFHDTWHILSDQRGARMLAHLMWGLSFHRQPDTILLIYGEHIQPTPFGAEASDPILVALTGALPADGRQLRILYRCLTKLGPSQQTIRWRTFGLDLALKQESCQEPIIGAEPYYQAEHENNRLLWNAECMTRQSGFLIYSAPPMVMRHQALTIAKLDPSNYGMDYHFLADNRSGREWPAGEVQIFRDYHEMRSVAAQARSEILEQGQHYDTEQQRYEAIADRRDRLLAARHYYRKRRANQRTKKPYRSSSNRYRNRKTGLLS